MEGYFLMAGKLSFMYYKKENNKFHVAFELETSQNHFFIPKTINCLKKSNLNCFLPTLNKGRKRKEKKISDIYNK